MRFSWRNSIKIRQGSILTQSAAIALEITLQDNQCLVAISHDCDIANDNFDGEPEIEFIKAHIIEKQDGNFTFAKNTRKLHIFIQQSNTVLEFSHTNKVIISKHRLLDTNLITNEPCLNTLMDEDSIIVLQRWLAARYHRASFPDDFNECLEHKGIGGNGGKIAKILKDKGQYIIALLFDVKPINDETIKYELLIWVVYTTSHDPIHALNIAQKAAQDIESSFRSKLFDIDWQFIELVSCIAISDEVITYKQAKTLKQWRAENISLAQSPHQESLEPD